jgi:hypothetical protein
MTHRPVLKAYPRNDLEVTICSKNRKPMLPGESRQDHVYLRQNAAQTAQFKIHCAVEPSRFGAERPEADMGRELSKPTTVFFWPGGLLDADLQVARHWVAGDESMPRPPLLMNTIADGRGPL